MRSSARPFAALIAALTLTAGLSVTGPPAAARSADAVPAAEASDVSITADTYSWKNARIDGGGFVPGIVFNRSEKNLAYARTDIGGAYRWDQTGKQWKPLLDWVDWDRWGWSGVVSVASDAAEPDNVYAAVGTYTNSWDPTNGAVLRSSDRGASWKAATLPFKLGGNMPGRGMGERLAVDPNKNSVLYLGAPSGNGLWRSTDAGVTWAEVTAFPNPGNYAQDPSDTSGYASDNQGIVWVTFDERTGGAGSATQDIYVGVADKANTVYRSTDAGVTWSRIAGQPTGYLAHKGVLDSSTGYLYLTTSDTGGPYDGAKGQIWRYATQTGEWKDVSPVAEADTFYGFSGLSVDRQQPGTLMATAYSSWWPDTQMFRSTDSGATWTQAWDYTSYPNRSNRFTQDVSSVPWLTWGADPSPPEVTPKLGWMTEALEIDPFGGVRGIFRSTDAGASWTRINDDAHQWGWTGAAITGDPRVYGRVYVATNGRGVQVGESSDSDGGTPDPDPDPVADCSVTYTVTHQWPGGFQADVQLTNTGSQTLNGWRLGWTFPDGQGVSQMWNATPSRDGAKVTATDVGWNAEVEAGSSAGFGFSGTWSGGNREPSAFTLGGEACTVG